MAKNNETTTRFNVDISELKSQFSEAQRRVKLAVSEFNAATSSMKDWEKSADGLSAKIKQLNSTYDAENDKLEALKKQLALVVAEQGEGSKAAQDLQIRINNQQAEVNRTAEALKDYKKKLQDLESGSSGAETALGKLTSEINKQEKELADLKDKYKNVVLEQGTTSSEAKELEAKIKSLSGELKDNRDTLQNVADAANNLDHSLEEVEESSKVANGAFDTMRVALGNLIAQGIQKAVEGLAEFTRLSIETGMNFDASMSKVSAISGATGDELSDLRDKAKEMGATTKFSATEASEAMQYMAMAGWKSEQMIDGISGIMDLAAASGEDLATTSDIVTDALTALGMTAADSGHFADVLAAATSNANTNVSLLGESFKFVAPIAGSMGASAEDLSLALGLMANSGIKGTQAGNSLKNALINLVKPTDAQTDAMKALGLITTKTVNVIDSDKLEKAQNKVENKTRALEKAQISYNTAIEKYGESSDQAQKALLSFQTAENNLEDANIDLQKAQRGTSKEIATGASAFHDEYGNMKSLGDIMEVLRDKMQSVSVDLVDSEGNLREYDDIISELSQSEEGLVQAEQLKNAAILFGKQNVSGMLAIINAGADDYNKLSDAINNADGTAKNMSETMQNNLAGDMTLLKSQLEGIRIEFYEKLEPTLRKGVDWISENLPVIVDKVYEVAYSVRDGIKETVKVIDTISPALAAIGTAIAGIAILGFIQNIKTIGLALKAWAMSTKLVTAAQWLLNAAMSANPIGLVVVAIGALVAAFAVLWNKSESFRNFWINLWDKIKEVASAAGEWIKAAFEKVVEFFTVTVPKVFGKVLEFFKGNWQSLLLLMVAPIAGGLKLLYDNCDGFKEFIDGFVGDIKNFFTGIGTAIAGFFTESIPQAIQSASEWFEELPHNIGVALGKAVAHVVKFCVNLADTAKVEIPKFIGNVVGFFAALPDRIWTWLKQTLNKVSEWGKNTVKTGKEKALEFIMNVTNFVKELPDKVWTWLSLTVSKVAEWGKNTVETGKEKGKEFVKETVSFFKELPGKIFGAITGTIDKIKDWGERMKDTAKEKVKEVKDAVIEGFESLPEKLSEIGTQLISGLWGGITGMGDWLKEKISGFGSGIIEGFTEVFDINSPSKVMEKLVGNNIVYGLVKGVTEKTSEAVRAMDTFAGKTMIPIENMQANIQTGVPAYGSGGTTNTSTTNNYYSFNQTNNSPKSLSRLEIYRQTKNQINFMKAREA